jgi:hypothetical protein
VTRTNPTRYLGLGVCGIGAVIRSFEGVLGKIVVGVAVGIVVQIVVAILALGSPAACAASATWEPAQAREAIDGETAWPSGSRAGADEASALLMDGVSATGPRGRAVVATLGGYDSAHASAIFQSRIEVRLVGALTLTGAFVLASGLDQTRVQPRVGLKLQLLSQLDGGVDLALGAGYRRDRYLQDDGMLEAFVAIGRRIGALSLIANVIYGSDLEGDDRKGDVRLSAMRGLGRHREWQVGLGFDGEIDLASFDPRRGVRGDSSYETFAGPIAAYCIGPWALLVEGGPVVIKAAATRVGVATLAGVGTAF